MDYFLEKKRIYFFPGQKFVSIWNSRYTMETTPLFNGYGRRGNMGNIREGEVFTLTDDNDEGHEVEVLGSLDVEGTEYVAVGLLEDIEEDTEEDIDIFFFRVEGEGELLDIESDEEFEKVSLAFEAAFEEKE
jgi:uncharacterized protein YrzB (UPF0473 family)